MIEQPNPLSLKRQCELLGLSRAALYYRPAEVSTYELELMALIDRQYLPTPFYGSRRMTAWLQKDILDMLDQLRDELVPAAVLLLCRGS